MYKHPGVYIEHVPSGLLAVEAASTSIAAFLGPVKRGDLVTANRDEGEPVYISNSSQFAQKFGEINDPAGGIRDEGDSPDYFGHAVSAFFANGGTKAYIVPLGKGDGNEATASIADPSDPSKAFYFTAASAGVWANGLYLVLSASLVGADAASSEYRVVIGKKDSRGDIEPVELLDGMVLNPDSGRFLAARVNNESALVTVAHLDIAGVGGEATAVLGTPLTGLDLGSIANGDTLKLKIHADPAFTINLEGGYATLAGLAADIQAKVRDVAGPVGRTAFLCYVTHDRRLLLVPGQEAAPPLMRVIGSETAAKLGLDPTVHTGGEVGAVDGAALDTKTITLKVGTNQNAPELTVTFPAALAGLAAVAAEIEAQIQGPPNNIAGFRASVVAGNRLQLRFDNGASNKKIRVTGGTAVGLGLDAAAESPLDLAYPQPFDAGTHSAESLLSGGADHGAPSLQDYKDALIRLRDYRDISILLVPGHHWIEKPGDNTIIEATIAHAEFMKNRMVIIDPPLPTNATKLETPVDVRDLGAPTSPYAALYYPWLNVPNPHYNPDTAANKPRTFAIPPSGAAAGMWARIDGRRGVWKAPAGLEATVRGSVGPTVLIGNDLQDNLNEWGVNCLRAIIGPTVVWGARTLATKSKPESRYIPVRRTQNMIGESLYNALQAVVFEPNDHRLWSSLRAAATGFMDSLHRAGAFQGEKASDAFYVRCGLGSTMTQTDIDGGIVRLVVGFAPLKPAEFVIVQIQQIVGQTS